MINRSGDVVRELMKQRDVDTKTLAFRLNVTSSCIYNYLNRNTFPISALISLADFFNVSLDYLVTGVRPERTKFCEMPDKQIGINFECKNRTAEMKDKLQDVVYAMQKFIDTVKDM